MVMKHRSSPPLEALAQTPLMKKEGFANHTTMSEALAQYADLFFFYKGDWRGIIMPTFLAFWDTITQALFTPPAF